MATPSHVDLSVLWVPIMPETSKLGPAMEDAGKQATEDFGKGSSGLGDKIHESFTKATDKVKDVFGKAGTDAGTSMSDSFKKEAKGIEDAAGDSGKKAGKSLADNFSSGAEGPVGAIAERLGGLIGGKLGDALHSLDEPLKSVGIDIGSWQDPIQDAVKKSGEFKDTISGASDMLKNMPGVIGRIGVAIGELAGPIAVAAAAGIGLSDLLDKIPGVHDHFHNPDGTPKSSIDAWVDRNIPGGRLLTHDKDAPSASPSGDLLPPDMRLGGAGGDKPIEPHLGSVGGDSGYNGLFDGSSGGLGGAGGFSGDLSGAAASSSPSAASSLTPRDIGSNKGLTQTSIAVKRAIATLFPQITDIGGWRPPDGYNEHSSGQALDVMIPGGNTALGNQIRDYVMAHAKELGVDYALWQQTQWNPDGSSTHMADRGSPTQNHMDHVHIHTTRGGGSGNHAPLSMAPIGGNITVTKGLGFGGSGTSPTGTSDDPIYVIPAGAAGGAGGGGMGGLGGGAGGSQGQQLGQGLLGGAMQSIGLDGSVFHPFGGSSNPMQWGAVKLGTGLANWAMGMFGGGAGGGPGTHPLDHAAAGLPLAGLDARRMGLPGIASAAAGSFTPPSGAMVGGSGGGGGMGGAGMGPGKAGGINAAISGGIGLATALFSDLNPGPGAPDSANYHILPNPMASAPGSSGGSGGGDTHNHFYAPVSTGMSVTQQGVKSPTHELQAEANKSPRAGALGVLPNSGGGPSL